MKRQGFTLTEVVVGVILLTIVWLAAVNVLVISRASGSLAKHKAQAVYVIQQAIESQRRQPFVAVSGVVTSNVSIDTKGTPDNIGDDLRGVQTITTTNLSADYNRVIVRVAWNESFFGRRKQVTESCGTYISKDPVAN